MGLFANVVFLAHAVPAAAVTDNSSVFTFENSTTFSPPNANMRQNYTPSAGTATTCPGTAGYTWQCSWTSDAFTSGQTMSAGTAQVDLYASNTNLGIVRKSQGGIGYTSNNGWTLSRPAVANGDVLIAMGTFRGGTGVNVTSVPSGWALVGMAVGCHSILFREFAPGEILTALERYRVTNALFVPAMLQFLASVPGAAEQHLPQRRSGASRTHGE